MTGYIFRFDQRQLHQIVIVKKHGATTQRPIAVKEVRGLFFFYPVLSLGVTIAFLNGLVVLGPVRYWLWGPRGVPPVRQCGSSLYQLE